MFCFENIVFVSVYKYIVCFLLIVYGGCDNRYMESINKLVEIEERRKKKNPGKANKENLKEKNKTKRGNPIPLPKVVQTKKSKAKRRSYLKNRLQKEIKENT